MGAVHAKEGRASIQGARSEGSLGAILQTLGRLDLRHLQGLTLPWGWVKPQLPREGGGEQDRERWPGSEEDRKSSGFMKIKCGLPRGTAQF